MDIWSVLWMTEEYDDEGKCAGIHSESRGKGSITFVRILVLHCPPHLHSLPVPK